MYIPLEPWTYKFVGSESKPRLFSLPHWITRVSSKKPGFSQQCLEHVIFCNCDVIMMELHMSYHRHGEAQRLKSWNTFMLIDETHATYSNDYKKCEKRCHFIGFISVNETQKSHIRQTCLTSRLGNEHVYMGEEFMLGILTCKFQQPCATTQ